jgi:hypothetical protein
MTLKQFQIEKFKKEEELKNARLAIELKLIDINDKHIINIDN